MAAYTREEIRARVADLGQWFHDLDLDGVRTAPDHFLRDYPAVKWRRFAHALPADLAGRTVLDIGCNAGFYSFAARLRGARSVLGLDYQPHYVNQALLLRDILGLDIEFRQSDGHELTEQAGVYDVVLNTGVIYHLQNPMDFLTKMARITREVMYLESEMLTDPKLSEYAWFIEKEYGQDSSNWWIYGPLCAERMARAAGFSRVEFQGFVWKPPHGMKTPEGFERQGRGAFLCWK